MNLTTEEPVSPFCWELIDDLSAVPEDNVVHYLLDRLKRGQIYTWVGSLLLAVNPCNKIPTEDIYDRSYCDKYSNASYAMHKEAKPHIFALAARAHYQLIQNIGKNTQVIVISGDTGSGKTFNACKILDFLVVVNRKNEKSSSLCERDFTCDITQKITDACRVISAFTTASTERNEVSSRHGQLLKLQYKDNVICGAAINSFLLESSRVTKGFTNFQIFYQIMNGFRDDEFGGTFLSHSEKYDILNATDLFTEEYFREGFESTLRSMEALGFTMDQKKQMFEILALLLHMGNIQFVQEDEACTIDVDNARSKEALRNTCLITCLSEEDIVELLTTILINPQSTWRKHSTYRRILKTVDNCRNRLYSIIRYLYNLLFRWLLNHVNKVLSVKHQSTKWLGILDIFGFEYFDKNGMEQLCVNYANERLQQHFMQVYLERGRKELQEEGFIGSEQSTDRIHLYKGRLYVLEEVLFAALNDACQSLVTIDIPKIIQQACSNSYKETHTFLREKNEKFVIKHYVGPVEYCIKDLLSKNTDKVPSEIYTAFDASGNAFLRLLIHMDKEQFTASGKVSTKKCTMLSKLKHNLDILIKELNTCDLHYVRCVKPRRLDEYNWDKQEFRNQLAYTGVLEALPLARCKYPIRFTYEEFYKRYSTKPSEINDPRKKCKIILESFTTTKDVGSVVHYGSRLIFLTEAMFLKLEFYRRKYRSRCAKKIQSFWLFHKQRKRISNRKYSERTQRLKKNISFGQSDISCVLEVTRNSSYEFVDDDDVFVFSDDEKEHTNLNRKTENSHEQMMQETFTKIYPENNNMSWKKPRFSKVFSTTKHEVQTNDTYKNPYVIPWLQNNKLHNHVQNDKLKADVNHNNDSKQELRNNLFAEVILMEKYHEENDLYIIRSGNETFFYKNRILSRRRPAKVPIKFHTRVTCLPNSHILPRTLLPCGLEDSL